MRKHHTPTSERVAIAEAVAERLKVQAEHRMKAGKAPCGNISTGSDEAGKTRDLAAAKAGFGSGKTLEAAQAVIAKGRQIVPTLRKFRRAGLCLVLASFLRSVAAGDRLQKFCNRPAGVMIQF